MQQERKEISGKANTIAGFSIPLYLGILALVVVCMYMDCLPAGLVGGMIALMVLGEGLNFLGNHTPVVKTYLGGSVICILGAAVIQALGLIPEQTHEILDNFVNKEGFLVFYISALITGSLFNIDRGLLIRATVKLLPTAVISLAVGGLMLDLPVRQLFFNMIPVLVLCMVLIAAFVLVPALTMKIMIFLGNAIRIFSFLLFGVAVFGIFMPKYAVVEDALIEEMLFMVLRMVIAACGGLVLSQVALKRLQKPIQRIGAVLGINEEAVVGLFLSFIQSLAMLPLFSKMDKRGKVLNAALSVAGAYVVGGQMTFVASLIPGNWVTAYMISKVLSGGLAVALAVICLRRSKMIAE